MKYIECDIMVVFQKAILISITSLGLLAMIIIGAFILNPVLFLESDDIIISNSLYIIAPRDNVQINDATITGNKLVMNASYGGGCKEHEFRLIASDLWLESYPVQTHVLFSHNANQDMCEAYFTEQFIFNLSPLKERYQELYQEDSATIVLRIEGGKENFSINYSF
jgi:hypothetical protein